MTCRMAKLLAALSSDSVDLPEIYALYRSVSIKRGTTQGRFALLNPVIPRRFESPSIFSSRFGAKSSEKFANFQSTKVPFGQNRGELSEALINDSHRELSVSRIKKPEREERTTSSPSGSIRRKKALPESFQFFVPVITSPLALIYLFNSPRRWTEGPRRRIGADRCATASHSGAIEFRWSFVRRRPRPSE